MRINNIHAHEASHALVCAQVGYEVLEVRALPGSAFVQVGQFRGAPVYDVHKLNTDDHKLNTTNPSLTKLRLRADGVVCLGRTMRRGGMQPRAGKDDSGPLR